jgi:L-rhamnose mutarotase
MIELRPGSERAYKTNHAAVGPEVVSKILECAIRNYSIFLQDGFLFSSFGDHGKDWRSER